MSNVPNTTQNGETLAYEKYKYKQNHLSSFRVLFTFESAVTAVSQRAVDKYTKSLYQHTQYRSEIIVCILAKMGSHIKRHLYFDFVCI